jgi:hypothetical protein
VGIFSRRQKQWCEFGAGDNNNSGNLLPASTTQWEFAASVNTNGVNLLSASTTMAEICCRLGCSDFDFFFNFEV